MSSPLFSLSPWLGLLAPPPALLEKLVHRIQFTSHNYLNVNIYSTVCPPPPRWLGVPSLPILSLCGAHDVRAGP